MSFNFGTMHSSMSNRAHFYTPSRRDSNSKTHTTSDNDKIQNKSQNEKVTNPINSTLDYSGTSTNMPQNVTNSISKYNNMVAKANYTSEGLKTAGENRKVNNKNNDFYNILNNLEAGRKGHEL